MDGIREKWTMGPIQMDRMRHVSQLKRANSISHYF